MKKTLIIALTFLVLVTDVASSQSPSAVKQQKDLDSIMIAPTDWESLKTIETIQDDCDFKNESDSCERGFPKPKTTAEAYNGIVIDECNKTARVLAAYKPCPTELARKANVSGYVTVTVVVDEAGFVTWARVWKGHPLLNAAALKAACKWRFEPARCGGEIQKVNRMITFAFAKP